MGQLSTAISANRTQSATILRSREVSSFVREFRSTTEAITYDYGMVLNDDNAYTNFVNATHNDTMVATKNEVPRTSITLAPLDFLDIPDGMRVYNGPTSAAEHFIRYLIWEMNIPYQIFMNIRPFAGYNRGYNLESDIAICKNNKLVAVVEINGNAHYTDGAQIFRDTLKVAQIINSGASYIPIDINPATSSAHKRALYKSLCLGLERAKIEFDQIDNMRIDMWSKETVPRNERVGQFSL